MFHKNILTAGLICGLLAAPAVGQVTTRPDVVNEWQKLPGVVGDRDGFDLFYVPQLKRFVLAGGYLLHGNPPYQEQMLNGSTGLWENHFPKGKEGWGPKVGPLTTEPDGFSDWKGSTVHLVDAAGKDLGPLADNWTSAPGQSVWDQANHRAIFYAFGRLAAYDPVERAWTDLKPAGDTIKQPLEGASLCYIPTTKEILLAGGNCSEKDGSPGTWIYDITANKWAPVLPDGRRRNPLQLAFRTVTQLMAGAEGLARGTLHLATLPDQKLTLRPLLEPQIELSGSVIAQISSTRPDSRSEQENLLLARMESANALEKELLDLSADTVTAAKVAKLAALREQYRAAGDLVASQPGGRANSAMAFDPKSGQVVLFGGDHLDYLLADTWVFDPKSRTWQQRFPKFSPAPRGGHAMVYLPKSGRVALIGGYDYNTPADHKEWQYKSRPLEVWLYDVAANRWDLLKRWELPEDRRTQPDFPVWPWDLRAAIAVDDDDQLLVASPDATWKLKVDLAAVPAVGTEQVGVAPGTVTRRGGGCDPCSYDPTTRPEAEANKKRLNALPANTWVRMNPPRGYTDYFRMATPAIDTDRQQLLWFPSPALTNGSTEVAMYSVRANTWRISDVPEWPIEFISWKNGYHDQNWTFNHSPLMQSSTKDRYAYDPAIHGMVLANGHHTFTFDPGTGQWSSPKESPSVVDWMEQLCSTPSGVIAWAQPRKDRGGQPALWRFVKDDWERIDTAGEKAPDTPLHFGGIAYDSRRKQALLFDIGEEGKSVSAWSADLASRKETVKKLMPSTLPKGLDYPCLPVYLPSLDMVLLHIAKKADSEEAFGIVYDVAAGKTKRLQMGVIPAEYLSRGAILHRKLHWRWTYDPARDLVWAVDYDMNVFAFRLDPKTAKISE